MANPFAFLGPLFRVVAEIWGWINKKRELNNTPEMQDRDQAKKDQEERDRINNALRDEDINELRK